jgi:phosphatidylinositol glycan class Z
MILSDSLYYGDITWKKLYHLKMNYTDWKVAPFNFIMYNAVPGNIASHGEHPRYTHMLVNLPLLLGPLAPVFLVTFLNWILDACYMPWKKKPALRSVYALTLFTTVVPLLALSAVKHQGCYLQIPLI